MVALFGFALLIISGGASANVDSAAKVGAALDSGEVRSVDDILKLFPNDMRRTAALVYKSGSRQRATIRRPRLLMSSLRADFFAGVASDETHSDYNVIEMAQLEFGATEPDFYLIDFNESPPRMLKNPEVCMRCHLVNGRRVLRIEKYPFWGGWYGTTHQADGRGFSSEFVKSEEEKIAEFLAHRGDNPRLAEIFKQSFPLRGSYPEDHMFRFFADQGATRLGLLISGAESKALYASLKRVPDFEKVKYAIAAMIEYPTMDAAKMFLPERIYNHFKVSASQLQEEILAQENAGGEFLTELLKRTSGIEGAPVNFDIKMSAKRHNRDPLALAFIEWLLRWHNDSLQAYSPSGYQPSFSMWNGSGQTIDYVNALLWKDLLRSTGLENEVYYSSGVPHMPDDIVGFFNRQNRITHAEELLQKLQKNSCSVNVGGQISN